MSMTEKFNYTPDIALFTNNGDIIHGNLTGIEFFGRKILVRQRTSLSPVRIKCLAMSAVGMSGREIGDMTYRSHETVKTNQGLAYKQLGASNIAHATRLLVEDKVLVGYCMVGDGELRVTSRDAEVLDLMSNGLTVGQAGEALYLSPLSVKSHMRSITVRNNMVGVGAAGLVMAAHFDGVIEPHVSLAPEAALLVS